MIFENILMLTVNTTTGSFNWGGVLADTLVVYYVFWEHTNFDFQLDDEQVYIRTKFWLQPPQYAIDLEKKKSNVNTFILLVQGLVCIFFDVTAGKCNVFKNHNKLLMCLLTPPPSRFKLLVVGLKVKISIFSKSIINYLHVCYNTFIHFYIFQRNC